MLFGPLNSHDGDHQLGQSQCFLHEKEQKQQLLQMQSSFRYYLLYRTKFLNSRTFKFQQVSSLGSSSPFQPAYFSAHSNASKDHNIELWYHLESSQKAKVGELRFVTKKKGHGIVKLFINISKTDQQDLEDPDLIIRYKTPNQQLAQVQLLYNDKTGTHERMGASEREWWRMFQYDFCPNLYRTSYQELNYVETAVPTRDRTNSVYSMPFVQRNYLTSSQKNMQLVYPPDRCIPEIECPHGCFSRNCEECHGIRHKSKFEAVLLEFGKAYRPNTYRVVSKAIFHPIRTFAICVLIGTMM